MGSLREEIDDLRTALGAGRVSPGFIPQPLASELNHSHSRTESSPLVTFPYRAPWGRASVASSNRTGGVSAWEHHRKSSMASSLASTSIAEGLASPGLGVGPVGEFGGALVPDDMIVLSPPPREGRESPKPIFRTSPSGGIAYVLNGVPKNKVVIPRPPVRRSSSVKPNLRSVSVSANDWSRNLIEFRPKG